MSGSNGVTSDGGSTGQQPKVCMTPRHIGPVKITRYWGKGGKYRARRCEFCGLEWKERILRFGRRGSSYWQRSILTLSDLPD